MKKSTKKLPAGFLDQVRADRKRLEREKPRLIAVGQRIRQRYDRLQDMLSALKAEREHQGVSLSELSRRTGISKASLSRLENDRMANPTVATLSRIADALGRRFKFTLSPAA